MVWSLFSLGVGFVFCQCVGWMSGLDFGLGLAGKSCGVNILVGSPPCKLCCVWAGLCSCMVL